jgi:hypothetical protein
MSLLGPNQEDLRKIHAEINQLVNQRFLLTTVAITVFGVVMGLLIPRTQPSGGVGGFVFLMCTLLLVLLFALFLLSHLYKGMTRVYSMYLIVTDSSQWEKDWKKYRKDWYVGYTKPQTVLFVVLSGTAAAFPYLLSVVYGIPCQPVAGLITLIAVGSLSILLMCLMGFGNLFDRERKAEQQWQAHKADQN